MFVLELIFIHHLTEIGTIFMTSKIFVQAVIIDFQFDIYTLINFYYSTSHGFAAFSTFVLLRTVV